MRKIVSIMLIFAIFLSCGASADMFPYPVEGFVFYEDDSSADRGLPYNIFNTVNDWSYNGTIGNAIHPHYYGYSDINGDEGDLAIIRVCNKTSYGIAYYNLDPSNPYGTCHMGGTCLDITIDTPCLDDPYFDTDGDGICLYLDNCPDANNPDQIDIDEDGIGDVCDNDDDNDLVVDPNDNCPYIYNPSQNDSDWDEIGNACDDDCPNLDELNPVDYVDFSILASNWLITDANMPGDLNFNLIVDANDLTIFSNYWLSDCYEE